MQNQKRKKIIAILIGLVIIIVTIIWYNGLFKVIQVKEGTNEKLAVVGLEYKGGYKNAGKYMKEVEGKIKSLRVNAKKGFGIYYDNPKIVPADSCRSFIGFVVDTLDQIKIVELKSAGIRADSIAFEKYIKAEFPIVNTLSYMIGPWKTYPILSDYLKVRNHKAGLTMEIYDTEKNKIIFLIEYH